MNKKVIIIGGSSSLGEVLQKDLLNLDYDITSTFFKNNNLLDKSRIDYVQLDLNNSLSIKKFMKNKKIINKKFDAIIFLSGIIEGKNIDQYEEKSIKRVMNINFIGFAMLFKMLKKNLSTKARIVILSSISADRGSYDPIYAASKGALISFMKSLSHWMGKNVRINCVAPGLIKDSNMFLQMSKTRQKYHKNDSLTREITKIEDLSKIILDIIQPHWQNMNGAVIRVNGGAYL